MLTRQLIRTPLLTNVLFKNRSNFIKNKMNYKELLIKNNQKNYNKIISRKNYTYIKYPHSGFGGGKDPFNYKIIVMIVFGIWLYKNSGESGNGNGNGNINVKKNSNFTNNL